MCSTKKLALERSLSSKDDLSEKPFIRKGFCQFKLAQRNRFLWPKTLGTMKFLTRELCRVPNLSFFGGIGTFFITACVGGKLKMGKSVQRRFLRGK